MSVSFGIRFGCMIRRRLLTVDRAPLLYDENRSISAAVTKTMRGQTLRVLRKGKRAGLLS